MTECSVHEWESEQESEASLSLIAPLCQASLQRLSANVSFCSVVHSVAAVSLLR